MRSPRFCGLALVAALLLPSRGVLGEETEAIPVTSELVRTACGACHEPDDRGVMSRISFQRKSPEGWQTTVKRMIRTGRVALGPDDARRIVRELADGHGLTPEEARRAFYRAEHRPRVETFEDEELEATCTRCHLGAWALEQRRTPEEWRLLKGMHLGYFPVIEFQGFRRPVPDWEPAAAEEGEESTPARPEGEEPWRADRVLDRLGETLPLDAGAWRAFRAKSPPPDLAGTWLFVAHDPGEGPVVGRLAIEAEGDEYVTRAELALPDGRTERREGRGVLYARSSWRGRSRGPVLGERREAFLLSDDSRRLEGRSFTGAFGELGMDVRLVRLGPEPVLAAVVPRAVRTGARGARVRLLGARLPDGLGPADVALGEGVAVTAVETRSPDVVELVVDVAADATPGGRDVRLAGAVLLDGFAVYDRIDYVKVLPDDAVARLGGVRVPKQLVRFEARGFHRGADGEPMTEDDVDLGIVPVRWSLEELVTREDDDDVAFVGTIDDEGLFTPNVEGPNPERPGGTNNHGNVWVVATPTEDVRVGGRPLRGRAHLLVTVPLYAYWEAFP